MRILTETTTTATAAAGNSSKKRLHSSKCRDVIMKIPMTLKKHRQAYGTAATLPLLLLIISVLTVPVMLFSAPLAAADVVSDCKDSGGTYVVNAAGQGHCFVTLQPDCIKLPPGEVVPDPELCLKPGGIVSDPIFDIADIAGTLEGTLNEVMPVIVDSGKIAESVQDTLDGIGVGISDEDN